MKKDNIFHEEELNNLPLTYRKMDRLKTKNVRELIIHNYGKSERHSNNNYPVTISNKPFSNYIINEG